MVAFGTSHLLATLVTCLVRLLVIRFMKHHLNNAWITFIINALWSPEQNTCNASASTLWSWAGYRFHYIHLLSQSCLGQICSTNYKRFVVNLRAGLRIFSSILNLTFIYKSTPCKPDSIEFKVQIIPTDFWLWVGVNMLYRKQSSLNRTVCSVAVYPMVQSVTTEHH